MKKPAAKKAPAKKAPKVKDAFALTRKVVVFPKDTKWAELRDDEIAGLNDCSANTVFRYRKANGKDRGPRKAGSGAKNRISPHKINMKLSAMANAALHGCSYGWMLHLMAEKRRLAEEKKATDITNSQMARVLPPALNKSKGKVKPAVSAAIWD